MKTIDHNPPKFPDYGEKRWAQDKYGEPKPSHLLSFLLPILVISIAMFLSRGY